MTTRPLDHARNLLARGLLPIPVPHKTKRPRLCGWQTLRLADNDLPRYFRGGVQNVGVLLGEPSAWIVDVDLDHPRALELADPLLPHTGATWGRASRPRSHRLYRLTRPAKTRKWMSKTDGMIVELRSTGCQTIAPGSVHPGGEVVRWDADGEPATINPDELLLALTRLANTVRSERASESQRNSNLTTDDPLDPIDPVDPANPVDPVRKLSPEQVIEMARVNGPGQHDSQTLVLARGLRLNAGLPSSDAARPHFDCWWVSACPRCADHDADASWFKFERAWDTVTIPLLAPGIAASVLAIIDRLPDVREAAGFGPKVRRLVNALAEMGRRSGGQPFALSARMVGDALGVSVATAHEWMGGLVRRGLLRCTDRGRPGTDGTGKARRLVWMGCQQATDVVG